MNLLAFSDVHTDRRRARRMVERARGTDLVIGAGDFARFHLGLHRTIATLREIEAPVLLVPGNNESETALRRACRAWPGATVLHGEAVAIAGTEFFGLGGGIPETPLPLSFDLSEDDAAAKLAPCPSGAVMIVHSPPWGHVDEVAGRHLGSKAILGAIEVRQPPLVLCGHVHEAWGCESRIGATRVVNLGPEGMFFEL